MYRWQMAEKDEPTEETEKPPARRKNPGEPSITENRRGSSSIGENGQEGGISLRGQGKQGVKNVH